MTIDRVRLKCPCTEKKVIQIRLSVKMTLERTLKQPLLVLHTL